MLANLAGRDSSEDGDSASTKGRPAALKIALVALLIAVPAGVLRSRCGVGGCSAPSAKPRVPFCSLEPDTRTSLEAGFREGRSPDIFMVTRESASGVLPSQGTRSLWPWPGATDTRVPLVFWGHGIKEGARLPSSARPDDLAPTLEALLGLERPHPEVRSGEPLDVLDGSPPPKLVVVIVLKGLSPEAAERLGGPLSEGAGTMFLDAGPEPADPAALLTTLGTGGIPAAHGITGSLLRDQDGEVVEPWGQEIPLSVIATLGDDLDEQTNQAARIGGVLSSPTDRGILGGTWYLGHDQDDLSFRPTVDEAREAWGRLIGRGYGDDEVPDLAVFVQEVDIAEPAYVVRDIEFLATARATPEVTFVLTGTPGAQDRPGDSLARAVKTTIDDLSTSGRSLVEAVVPGGVFLDQDALADEKLNDDVVIAALKELESPDGDPVFLDVFPQIAISLGRFC